MRLPVGSYGVATVVFLVVHLCQHWHLCVCISTLAAEWGHTTRIRPVLKIVLAAGSPADVCMCVCGVRPSPLDTQRQPTSQPVSGVVVLLTLLSERKPFVLQSYSVIAVFP